MQVITQHPYAEQVLTPLAGDADMGQKLDEDAALEFLDNEIMKIGSLAHTEIDWPKVESEALKILSDRSKDLRVLGFLLLALQRGGDGERFALSLYLLQQVLEHWWPRAWPCPGDRGQRPRKMLFAQVLQRSVKPVSGLAFDSSVGDGRGFCLELVAKLAEQAETLGLATEALDDLSRAIEQLPKVSEPASTQPDSQPGSQPGPQPGTQAGTAAPIAASPQSAWASLGALTLDPGNERATRQSLLKVADLLTANTPGSALGYRIRRYAIWYGISSVPPTRDGVRTDLAAVSADRVAEYRESLDKVADAELWQRIEQSLSVSPFWLDGHWLSARAAMALGNTDCAEAIREALKAFVDRLPQLAELTFNDGTPFLSDDGADWLHTAPAAGKGTGAGANPWEQAFDGALELVRQNKLAPAMELLEQGLADAREPRERFYWRLATARLLKETGLKALAAEQIQDLKNQIQGRVLEDWEPALIKQLERLA